MNTYHNTKEFYFPTCEFNVVKINNEVYDLEIGDITITLDLMSGNGCGSVTCTYERTTYWIDDFYNTVDLPIFINKVFIGSSNMGNDSLTCFGTIELFYNNNLILNLECITPFNNTDFFAWIIIDDGYQQSNNNNTFYNTSIYTPNLNINRNLNLGENDEMYDYENDINYIDRILPNIPFQNLNISNNLEEQT